MTQDTELTKVSLESCNYIVSIYTKIRDIIIIKLDFYMKKKTKFLLCFSSCVYSFVFYVLVQSTQTFLSLTMNV